jgi:hypothetical protein
MIKLKDLLLESTAPDIFIPRRIEDRFERMISLYVRNGSKGDLNLSGMNLTKLPDILKNVTVGRNFFCSNNKLTSLQGAPTDVGGSFDCSYNDLTTLEGGPVKVGRDFWCSYNDLTSLEFAPTNVGRDFDCIENQVKFTKEQVRAVCDVKGDIFV